VRRDKLMYDQSVKVRPEKRRSSHLRTELCTLRLRSGQALVEQSAIVKPEE